MNYTNIEQSKKLLELGLSPESADMCYLPIHLGEEHHWTASLSSYSECTKMTDVSIEYCIPCWSVGALLELMPRLYKVEFNLVIPGISKELPYIAFDDCNNNIHEDYEGTTILEATYNMIIWLLENGYIKKGE